MRAKDGISLILEIIRFIDLFIGIDFRVGVVEGEVQFIFVLIKESLNLRRRMARSKRVGSVFTGFNSNKISRGVIRGMLTLESKSSVQGWT